MWYPLLQGYNKLMILFGHQSLKSKPIHHQHITADIDSIKFIQ